MRLKSMNKTNNNTNTTRNANESNHIKNEISYSQESNNGEDNSFDLDMDSGEDEIDVGTHADSMLSNYNSNNNMSANAAIQNDHQFGISNQHNDNPNMFAVPQQASVMSEADRKRAHHNALERKRRDHIKDSFHTLRDAIPNIKGEKVSTSRAQILKAATDYIKTMKTRNTVYQNDIDTIKKQNMEIENQIRLIERAKATNQNSSLNIKTESIAAAAPSTNSFNEHLNSDDNEYKLEYNESPKTNNTLIHNGNGNILKANNVLILTKPSSSNATGSNTSKKFKTIYNTKNNVLNGNFM